MENRLIISILQLRQKIYELYQKNSRVCDWIIKGLAAYCLFLSVNSQYGCEGGVMGVLALVLTVICAFLPFRFVYPAMALMTAFHLFEISIDMAAVYLAVVVLSYLFVCRYSPNSALIIAFTPLFFATKLAFLLPILVGIFASIFGTFALVFGVVLYYAGVYSPNVIALISSADGGDSVLACQALLHCYSADNGMLLLIAAFVLAAMVTYFLYHQSFDHAWYIGITAGGLAGLVVYLVGDIIFDIQTGNMMYIYMIPVAILLAAIVQFFRCIIDYSGAEYVEYEDDEYYYYVKAVPKVKEIVDDFAVIDRAKEERRAQEEAKEMMDTADMENAVEIEG